jgi:hypothetical protein
MALNIACELQPAQTDSLFFGFVKFFFGHGSCREEVKTTPSKNVSHAETLTGIARR